MITYTLPPDAERHGKHIVVVRDGEPVFHAGHRRAVPGLGVTASRIDTGERRPPAEFEALMKPCEHGDGGTFKNGWHTVDDEMHRCDGRPLIDVRRTCYHRGSKSGRLGDFVCDGCGARSNPTTNYCWTPFPGSTSLGRFTVEVLRAMNRPDNADDDSFPAAWITNEGRLMIVLSATTALYPTIDIKPDDWVAVFTPEEASD